ncbi:hypothetical protein P43SY_004155 [Pythium insidiosum]|uniref:Uncharacterized protein n=1 Tax=Pythium insidiosum TaxID=114742 RepID=A0AAD5Q5E3_PYTIN|nr:hypothetical protein P43SY_004155 [Pythium insidiosum]
MAAQRWPEQFALGISAAVTGCVRALTEPVLRAAFIKSAVQLLLWSLGLIALVHLVVLPLEWTLSWLLPQAWIDASLRALRLALTSGIPFMLVTTCRYVQVELFETAFFAGLAQRDAALAAKIRSREAIYWDWEYVRHAAVVAGQQLLFGLVFVLISPVFGALIPLARFGYKIRRMERLFWVPIFLGFCLPSTRPMSLRAVQTWVNARELSRELYDPVIARLKSVDAGQQAPSSAWHTHRSDAARLGFSMVASALLQVPVVGPLTWFVVFVAAGLHAPELVNLSAFKLLQD